MLMKGMVVMIMIAVIIMIEGIFVGDGDSKVDLMILMVG